MTGLPSNDLGEFSFLLLLLGDESHVIQEGIHLSKCEGAGLARWHEGALLKEVFTPVLRQADLTQQFYGLYAKGHVLQREVKRQWRELCSLPEDQQVLEKGGVTLHSTW